MYSSGADGSGTLSEYVKENVVRVGPLGARALWAALVAAAAALAVAAHADLALPSPLTRTAPPHRFIAEIAHEHLLNLTTIGPRVSGSYENEVLGVGVVVEAVRSIARGAGPHVAVELDVQRAHGAYPLAFMDGMNHVYEHVQNVVVRVRARPAHAPAPAPAAARRDALLLNCHIDTVPDSPGASDDGAGCAVLLEVMRALAAARSPPRRAVIFLFNGAEENVLQGSHGFITQHKWARTVRAFVNLEACGAGGREVLFQAGPHDPWIVELYARVVPHPFASSLAQEVFQSGLVPADTDFRIFRDFGGLSGVDLAWSANGYVYHTALDTASRVPPAALQRTGDNVLALVHGMVRSDRMDVEPEVSSRQPVFFDVLGVVAVSVRARTALLAAAAALALAALDLHLEAGRATKELFMRRSMWWRCAARGACVSAASGAAGVAAAALHGALLHAAGLRLSFYARPALLAPLYAAPALLASWCVARRLCARWRWARGAGGWWAARALHSGGTLVCGGAVCACAALQLRSGFLPALWTALPAAAGCAARGRAPAWAVCAGAALPMLQTWYLAVPTLRMFVPVAGRASSPPLPLDVSLAALTAALTLTACSWLLPLVVAARNPRPQMWWLGAATALGVALAACGAPYSAEAPQRIMVFHTRRTQHHAGAAPPAVDHLYWLPQMDANAPTAVDKKTHVRDEHRAAAAPPPRRGGAVGDGDGAALPIFEFNTSVIVVTLSPSVRSEVLGAAEPVSEAECARWVYCGAPYYLPVLSLLPRSHRAAAAPRDHEPPVHLRVALHTERHNRTHHTIHLHMTGAAHKVVIVSPAAGARLAGCSALQHVQPSEPWGNRSVYFFSLHDARGAPAHAALSLRVEGLEGATGTQLSVAGHALATSRAGGRAAQHEQLLRALPAWTAPTGWPVDLHLYQL